MTTMKTTSPDDHYLFDSGSDLGAQQLNSLSALFDGNTRSILSPLLLPDSPHCLEIGAGNGSVARMIAEQTGGQVVAIDLDTTHLPKSLGVEPRRHDIREGVPVGPFDLIHARLVLTHLSARREIFAQLVDELAPGGWLVLADVGLAEELLVAPQESDHDVWAKYNDAAYRQIGPAAGHDYSWADQVEAAMLDAGLTDVAAEHVVPLGRGGGPWAMYHSNLSRQAEAPLLSTGLSMEDMERYRTMLADPEFRARFFSLTYTIGRKPTA
ncbi:class I SAM-dependent methyltransferase [Brevibacterium picturae]|uniref:Methyltransferase domain-containing protein n=1 Tax=Brevibacterium picturae TaxID=260553 RepID=A0ABP4MVN8_9MICO